MADIYVGPASAGAADGSSWANRYGSLSAAEAKPPAAGDRVVVGPGVYRETLTLGVSGGNLYTTGTVSVTNGSATVTGSGTTFTGNVFANGIFQCQVLASGTDGVTDGTATFTSASGNFQTGHVGQTIRIDTKGAYIISAVASATSITLKNPDGTAPSPSAGTGLTYNVGPEAPYEIQSVDSNTQLTLKAAWYGPTLTGIGYKCWRDIKYVADVTGMLTDGVGGVVRITGSNNDTTATRNFCITGSSRSYRTFIGLRADLCANTTALFTDCAGIVLTDMTLEAPGVGGLSTLNSTGASQSGLSVLRSILHYGSQVASFQHSASVNNAGHYFENCLIAGANSSNLLYNQRVGGIVFRNCTFRNGSTIRIVTALGVGQAVTFHNCICAQIGNNFWGTTSGEIIEDYNNLYDCANSRVNTGVGANSTATPSLWDTPPLLSGWRLPPPHLSGMSVWSEARAAANFLPPPIDLFGRPRPTTTSKVSRGAVQFSDVSRSTTQAYAGSASLKMADAGAVQFIVPTSAASTTFSVRVYREASYAGAAPQMTIRQPGQTATTVTDSGGAAGWNLLTTTLTPAALPGWVVIELASNNTATSGSYGVYFDALTVSASGTPGTFETWLWDRQGFEDIMQAGGGGAVSISPLRGRLGG